MTKKSVPAHLLPKLTSFCIPLIPRRARVLVGLSGGPDSVCLLHFLHYLSKKNHFYVAAAHVNHSLRGAAALADQHLSQTLCRQLGIDFVVKKISIRAVAKKYKLSPEHAARKGRYQALQQAATAFSCTLLALGHHADDQAETFLLNLLRGTQAKGLCGIPLRRPLTPEIEIIRPLLCVTRQEILAYLEHNHLPSAEDKTNQDCIYTRNWVRHALLPLLEQKQPQIRSHILSLTQELHLLLRSTEKPSIEKEAPPAKKAAPRKTKPAPREKVKGPNFPPKNKSLVNNPKA